MNRFNFHEVLQKHKQTERELIVLLSNQAQNYFLSSFKKQGFGGKAWKEVQRRQEGTSAFKYPKSKGLSRRTLPILVKSGQLRRSVSMMARTAQIKTHGFRMVVQEPYAVYHNEGMKPQPKRQFVGQTPELTQMQLKKTKQIMDKIWQA